MTRYFLPRPKDRVDARVNPADLGLRTKLNSNNASMAMRSQNMGGIKIWVKSGLRFAGMGYDLGTWFCNDVCQAYRKWGVVVGREAGSANRRAV